MLLRASGSTALLLAGLCIAAIAQSRTTGERPSIQQIIFQSPVQLTTVERRKLSAKIRGVGLDDAEELVQATKKGRIVEFGCGPKVALYHA